MEKSPVTGVKLSSVVPATVTGNNMIRNLTAMDLAVKLHYIRSVYFFKPSPFLQTLTIDDFKKPFFRTLQIVDPSVSGRIRRSEPDSKTDPTTTREGGGRRLYVRCNDSGVRIVEATVEGFTVEEWLAVGERTMDHEYLVYDQVLGPDLGFSPLVVLQMTRFKCGGISIGLNWAHVLGDAFSASAFMNILSQTMSGKELSKPVYPEITESKSRVHKKLSSIKKIEPVGDYWLPTNTSKMGRQTFCLSSKQIEHLMATYNDKGKTFSDIEIIYAIVWKSLSNIREGLGPKIVTICEGKRTKSCSNNGMVISTVELDDSSYKHDEVGVIELATLIQEKRVIQNGNIEETIEKDEEISDFILYGANLTFVNLEMTDLCEFKLNGEKSEFVNYIIHGIGDEGVVLVLPGSKEKEKFAMVVTIVIPEEQLSKLKDEVNKYWDEI